MTGLIGRKLGMTQIYNQQGHQVPVTVIEVGPCVVVQRKTLEKDGYDAVQLGFGEQGKGDRAKPMKGHFKKAQVPCRGILREFPLDSKEDVKAGDTFTASVFEGITFVDVVGESKGRGFQGVVKRYGMHGGRASHGSGFHRRVGAIGQCAMPSRVFKNKKMPGQMGNKRVTVHNLKVLETRAEDNMILLQGAVPGPTGGTVTVRKAGKKRRGSS